MIFDPTFDFRSDSNGKDPDSHSKTLKRHHKYLWTKLLPSGELFHLEDKDTKKYLVFYGAERSHYLTSDSIGNSFSHHRGKIASVISQIDPEQLEEFRTLNSTIGGSILFPGNKVEGRMTINGERGFNRFIADRFDLTLECIRRHYLAIDNPLRDVLNRYDQFFHLFKDFQNYVDFFQINDLVSADYSEVLLFIPNEPLFESSPLPKEVSSYLDYREESMKFVRLRNQRLSNWVANLSS